MTPDEFDFLFNKLISARNLTVDEDTWGYWWDAMKDVETPVFKEAVRRMIAEDESYPSPAHVRQVCRYIMQQRLARAVQPPPPSGLDTSEYSRWHREWQRQIVRGVQPVEAERQALESAENPALSPGRSPQRIPNDPGSVIRASIAPF